MTETKEKPRTTQEIREDLELSQDAEAALSREIVGLQEAMREAARNEEELLTKSALSGKALKGSKLPEIMKRRDELPGLLWAARLRTRRLKVELWTREIEEAREDEREAGEEASEFAKEEQAFRERKDEALARRDFAHRRWRDRNMWRGQIQREIEALEDRGPDPSVVATNPLKRPRW